MVFPQVLGGLYGLFDRGEVTVCTSVSRSPYENKYIYGLCPPRQDRGGQKKSPGGLFRNR